MYIYIYIYIIFCRWG